MARHRASAADRRANGGPPHNGASANGHPTTNGYRKSFPGNGRVLVLNASFEPINVCTVRRAAVLVLKDKAVLLERAERPLRSERLSLDRPTVIRLISFVRIPRDAHGRKITRKAVLARDSWTCQYCGTRKPGLTVDHVIPRSRGGKSVWENIVASCATCNRRKGSHLPREIKMHPHTKPRAPGPTVFIRIASPTIPHAWQPYLAPA
ncbi:MAG TPA: HNH endonuclease [Solirubrobacterales bacterium]|jgi:5-methylcytosine-specific restriction endonuclease McrA|nr:HNH endonuclease [Actinomycetota bacterium]